MRNIFEYPITAEEMIESLDRAILDRQRDGIQVGDVNAVCLHLIKDLLNENKQFQLKRFLDEQPRYVKGSHLVREEVVKLYEDFCHRTGRGRPLRIDCRLPRHLEAEQPRLRPVLRVPEPDPPVPSPDGGWLAR